MNEASGAAGGSDGVALIRRLWASLTAAGALVASVRIMIGGEWGGSSGIVVAVVLGLLSLSAGVFCRAKKLDASSEQKLAESYRQLFFLSFALVEGPYMVAFVLSFVMKQNVVVVAALPLYLFGMFLIAPLSGELRRRQQQITAQGSSLSLEDALRKIPPGRAGMAP